MRAACYERCFSPMSFNVTLDLDTVCVHAAEGLDTGKEYEFRVLAKNLAGLGEPSQPSKSVVTKPKAGQWATIVFCSLTVHSLGFYGRPM